MNAMNAWQYIGLSQSVAAQEARAHSCPADPELAKH